MSTLANVAVLLYAIAKVAVVCGFGPVILVVIVADKFPERFGVALGERLLRKTERAVSSIALSNKPARKVKVA